MKSLEKVSNKWVIDLDGNVLLKKLINFKIISTHLMKELLNNVVKGKYFFIKMA